MTNHCLPTKISTYSISYSDGSNSLLNDHISLHEPLGIKIKNCLTAFDGHKKLFKNFGSPFVLIHTEFAICANPPTGEVFVITDQEFHMILRVVKEQFAGEMSVALEYVKQLCKGFIVGVC